jgi:chromosome segregation ATPase
MKKLLLILILTLGQFAAQANQSDELIYKLAVISVNPLYERPFSEIITLTENAVTVMRSEYFKKNEDYTDLVLGDKLKQITQYLTKIAQNNANIYSAKLNSIQNRHKDFTTKKDVANAQITAKNGEIAKINSAIAGKNARRTQLAADRAKAQADYDKADREYDKKNTFWHGFLTGISFGAYNAFAELEKIEKHLNSVQAELDALDSERWGLDNDLNRLNGELAKAKEELVAYQWQIDECNKQIDKSTVQKAHYSDIALFFSTTAATFKYTNSGVNAVLNELAAVRKRYAGIF